MSTSQVDILLVEDSQEDLDLTLHILRKENLAKNIRVARDGEEALEFLQGEGSSAAGRPKLVLLDLKLPKIDGLQVLKQLKSDPLTRAIPVVILTSSKEERDLVKGYQLGANSYIQKPVDFEQFRETIKAAGLYWLLINQAPMRDEKGKLPGLALQ